MIAKSTLRRIGLFLPFYLLGTVVFLAIAAVEPSAAKRALFGGTLLLTLVLPAAVRTQRLRLNGFSERDGRVWFIGISALAGAGAGGWCSDE